MPCFHCERSLSAVVEHRLSGKPKDEPFPMIRTMGASGPRLAPPGRAQGRICGGCGVLFFPLLSEVKEETPR